MNFRLDSPRNDMLNQLCIYNFTFWKTLVQLKVECMHSNQLLLLLTLRCFARWFKWKLHQSLFAYHFRICSCSCFSHIAFYGHVFAIDFRLIETNNGCFSSSIQACTQPSCFFRCLKIDTNSKDCNSIKYFCKDSINRILHWFTTPNWAFLSSKSGCKMLVRSCFTTINLFMILIDWVFSIMGLSIQIIFLH